MATIAICIVKVIRLQKPSPKDFATAIGAAPFSMAAAATTATARQTNTKASGNQRSAQLVKRSPTRASAASPEGSIDVGEGPSVPAATVSSAGVICARSPSEPVAAAIKIFFNYMAMARVEQAEQPLGDTRTMTAPLRTDEAPSAEPWRAIGRPDGPAWGH